MSVADSLRKLREQATEGPWEILEDPGSWTYDVHGADSPTSVISMALDDKTAAFVAGAANLWPLLCDLAEAAEQMPRVSLAANSTDPLLALRRALSVLADATQEPA